MSVLIVGWLLPFWWPTAAAAAATTPAVAEVPQPPFQVIMNNDKTMSHLIFNRTDALIYCELFDLEKPAIRLPLEAMAVKPPLTVHYRTMLQAVRQCSELAWTQYNVTTAVQAVPETTTSSSNNNSNSAAVVGRAAADAGGNTTTVPAAPIVFDRVDWNETAVFWRGIVPGTKWCGLGDIAQRYDDLGPKLDIDLCCRAHDHCPVRLRAFRSGYGIFNFSFYTRLYCDCDQDFYQCLKRSPNSYAAMLGHLYFNVLRIQCLKEDSNHHHQQCGRNQTTITQCHHPEPSTPAFDARMKVVPFGVPF